MLTLEGYFLHEYESFLHEKEQIDQLLAKNYEITGVTENLSGAFIDFKREVQGEGDNQVRTLHILTPNGRMYFSNKILLQQKKGLKVN
ncbi:hypothetical protein EWH99_12930 [Sporolactobacillus sp. THM7-7]|nr:hypothetical protein EWH99_12930 [Sporolactobacillus sp. THM7-7]